MIQKGYDADWMSISNFQFDNLVQGRVPCIYLHSNFEFSKLYSLSTDINYFARYSLKIEIENFNELFLKEQLDQNYWTNQMPVVFLLANENLPSEWIAYLVQQGFKNIFVLDSP